MGPGEHSSEATVSAAVTPASRDDDASEPGLTLTRGRLEAFSDGVIAILITIMVLELHVPAGTGWHALSRVAPAFFVYVLSFAFLGIYWNNHHHMLHTIRHVNGGIMWANLHLLFWLSLIPFVTNWVGAHGFRALPVATYGGVGVMAAVAYYLLARAIIRAEGESSLLARAIQSDVKGKISPPAYLAATGLAFISPWISISIYVGVALMWLVPDRRIEAIGERR